ncbi:ankyrin [Rhizodiscina lignyota]|uniref:Ankyrin n=1 Tax=Rhizodiscina lignyota TaxID=1504668 RepID=A0A9P4MCJ4_9PEZI|nr:ankyrin [Rhizodiscina lignyota]
MDPVSFVSAVASLAAFTEAVLSNVLSYAKAVKESQKELSHLSSEIVTLAGTLRAAEILFREVRSTAITDEQINQCLSLLQEIDDRLKKSKSDSTSDGRMKRFAKSLKWPFTLPDTKELIEKIGRHKATFNLAISSEGLSAVLRNQNEVANEIRDLRQEIKTRHEVEARIELNAHRKQILSFFEKVDAKEYFDTNRRIRHEGTGVWFTKGDTMRDWLASRDSNLWLYGIPGAGKTVLSSAAIATVLEICKPDEAVAFFYCDYKKQETQDPQHIFGSLVKQLAIQSQDAFELLSQYHAKIHHNGSASGRLNVEHLVDLIRHMTGHFKTTSIIVDGLDECGDNIHDVLDQWTNLFQGPAGALRTAIFSRDEFSIRKALCDQHYTTLSIAAQSTDIKLYAGTEIERRCRRGTLELDDPSLKGYIMDKLVEKAQGMFRWVACQFDFLENLTSEEAYRNALESLPPDLPATYERMLERVLKLPESTQRMVQEALKWILFAWTPLDMPELCDAVSVEVGAEKRNPRSIVKPAAVERHCGSFIRKSANGMNIESAHFTVKEFFLNLDPKTKPCFARFAMNQESVCADLASTCLTYLNYADFKRPVPDDIREYFKYPFYDHAAIRFNEYAGQSWHHCHIQRLGQKLFDPERSPNSLLWCHYYSYMEIEPKFNDHGSWKSFLDEYQRDLCGTSTLYWVALMHITELLEIILSSGSDVNHRTPFGTPLHAAILGADALHLPRTIVESDSDGDWTSNQASVQAFNSIELKWKWNGRHRSCVELLLSYGADMDIPWLASEIGVITTYELLLYSCDTGLIKQVPKPNDPFGADWLERLRRFLVEVSHYSDLPLRVLQIIDASNVPMTCGVEYSKLAVRIRTTDNFETVSADCEDTSVLLRAAAAQGSVDLVKEILSLHGVDVDSPGEAGETALHLAASIGSTQCMDLLIQKGAFINKRDSKGRSALHYAASSSQVECIDMLLELKLDPEETTEDDETLSHLAAYEDNREVLKMLLERFGEKYLHANDRDALGRTPAINAAIGASGAALQFLLPFSNPNDKDLDDEPLLHHAAKKLSLNHVTTILDRGADPLAKCADGSTVLHHIAANPLATMEYVQMVLDRGVSKNDTAKNGTSPLHVLLVSEHFQNDPKVCLAMLLASETNINIPNQKGNTPLHLLLDAEIVVDVKLRLLANFLEIGADLTLRTSSRGSFFCELIRELIKDSYENTPEGIKQHLSKTQHIRKLLNITIAAINEVRHLEQPVGSWRPLQACIFDESLSLQLLSKGIDPNLRNPSPGGFSALEQLCITVSENHSEHLILKLCEAYRSAPSLHSTGDSLLHILCKGPCTNESLLHHTHKLIPNVNIRGENGDLSLIHSIQLGNVSFVEQLLVFGARLDLKGGSVNQRNWYPLHWAAHLGNENILHLFSRHTVEWNLKAASFKPAGTRFDGCSALHLAVLNNKVTAVNFLLDRALIDVNVRDDRGRTPLHSAAAVTDGYMIASLIDRGADVKLLDNLGWSALHHGVFNVTASEEVLGLLVDSGTPQGPDKNGDTPKALAMCEGRSKAMEILKGLQTDEVRLSPDAPETTSAAVRAELIQSFALSRALERGNLEVFKQITSAPGQSVDQMSSHCGVCTLFVTSLCRSETPFPKWLLNLKCNPRGQINCGPLLGYTAVHLAARHADLSRNLLPTLLDAVDPEEWSTNQFSPLHVSVACRNHEGTVALLRFMAETASVERVERQNGNVPRVSISRKLITEMLNKRPRDYPNERRPQLELIDPQDRNKRHLLQSNFSGTPLHLAAVMNEVESAKSLLENGAEVDTRDVWMWTPLHFAVSRGHLEMVKLLLDNNSNPNRKTLLGGTALMHAAECGKHDVFRTLVAYGADVNAQNVKKATALMYCRGPDMYSLAVTAGCHWNYESSPESSLDMTFEGSISLSTFIMNSRPGDNHEPTSLQIWVSILPQEFRMLLRLSRTGNRPQTDKSTAEKAMQFLVPAALRDDARLIELICTELENTDLESLREALIRAASWGRLCAVKSLLRRALLHSAERVAIVSMAYMASKDFPDLQAWILVDQVTEQLAIEAGGQLPEALERVKFWSGIRQIEIPLEGRYGRVRRSLLDWAVWLHSQDKEMMIAYSWRGCKLR